MACSQCGWAGEGKEESGTFLSTYQIIIIIFLQYDELLNYYIHR